MRGARVSLLFYCRWAACLSSSLLPSAFSRVGAAAQKKPKQALKESDARRVIAATPGFGLRTGAVKVKEVSPRARRPYVVGRGDGGLPARGSRTSACRRPAASSRRSAGAPSSSARATARGKSSTSSPTLGAERLEAARLALEELVTEFERSRRAAAEEGRKRTACRPIGERERRDGKKRRRRARSKDEAAKKRSSL